VACAFAGPAEGIRLPESFGFGVTPAPVPRGTGGGRLGALGMMVLPWSGGGGPPLSTGGNADLAWMAPFDVAGRIRRVTIPLASASLSNLTHRPYEASVGHVIDLAGRVAPIAAGSPESCLAGLLEPAGVTRPLGGCAPAPAVGVDLGDRVLLLSTSYRGHVVSAVDLRDGKGTPAAPPRELHTQPVAQGAGRFAFGAGARGGAGRGAGASRRAATPVFVAVGGLGDAVLSEVDPERGVLGPVERLAPLGALRAGGDPRCAPRPDQARVVLPFDTQIGLAAGALPGVVASGTAGLAVIRWSATDACLDAIELGVRDERYEVDLGLYDPAGTVKKVVAHLAGPPALRPIARTRGDAGAEPAPGREGAGAAPAPGREGGSGALIVVTYGQEVRQRLSCQAVAP
jgi:hypothetical protein